MSDEEASASREESVGDALPAPERRQRRRVRPGLHGPHVESMEALADATTVKDKLRILCELTEVNGIRQYLVGVFVDYL